MRKAILPQTLVEYIQEFIKHCLSNDRQPPTVLFCNYNSVTVAILYLSVQNMNSKYVDTACACPVATPYLIAVWAPSDAVRNVNKFFPIVTKDSFVKEITGFIFSEVVYFSFEISVPWTRLRDVQARLKISLQGTQ